MLDKKETVSIIMDWKEGFQDEDLVQLAEWLSGFVDGYFNILQDSTPDSLELCFIRTEE